MGVTESEHAMLTDCGGHYLLNAAGCYVHGIFDSAEVSDALIRNLYRLKGLEYRGESTDRRQQREEQLNRLADIVRENLDISAIYRIMEEGV